MNTDKEANEIGCYNLAGAIIRQALFDYQFYSKKTNERVLRGRTVQRQMEFLRDSAETFLFSENRLEEWLCLTGLDKVVNIDYIRHVAKNVNILGQRKIDSVLTRKLPEQEEIL